MSITFVPQAGDVLMCDFGPDPRNIQPPGVRRGPLAVPPEVWKIRQAIIIAGRPDLCIVVPLSTVAPRQQKPYHVHIPAGTYPFLDQGDDSWAKADLIEAVSRDRLDRVRVGGRFQKTSVSREHLQQVRAAVLDALSMGHLIRHL